MDTTGIIQLVIATILYSTLIAPSVKRMSDLKSDIANICFPIKTDNKYQEQSAENARFISSKLDQYGAAYSETIKFLWILYVAMGVVFASQVLTIVLSILNKETPNVEHIISAVITAVIFILLIVSMNIFITKPKKIRTFRWMHSMGIRSTYVKDIFNPSLEINSLGRNMRESNNHIHIKISSDIALYGYSIILTIEGNNHEKLYYSLAGRIRKSKYLGGGGTFYSDGRTRSLVDLVHSLTLKPGKYIVRLLIFETIFPGSAHPAEVSTEITVTESDVTSEIVYIDLSSMESSSYSYKVEEDNPYCIEYADDIKSNGLQNLLSSSRFQKKFTHSDVLFSFYDANGMITYDRICIALNPTNVLTKRFKLWLKSKRRRSFKSYHLELIK